VARRGVASLGQIAKDFEISETCLRNWLRRAGVDHRPGQSSAEATESSRCGPQLTSQRRCRRRLRAPKRLNAAEDAVPAAETSVQDGPSEESLTTPTPVAAARRVRTSAHVKLPADDEGSTTFAPSGSPQASRRRMHSPLTCRLFASAHSPPLHVGVTPIPHTRGRRPRPRALRAGGGGSVRRPTTSNRACGGGRCAAPASPSGGRAGLPEGPRPAG
jgi:transposase